MRRWPGTVLAIAGVVLATMVVRVIGSYTMRTGLWLGACVKDWTSPSSFQPRLSPLMRSDLRLEGAAIRVCYGSPSARGREVMGNLVQYDRVWRTGANEPTRIFVRGGVRLGDLAVPAGRYSLYTMPDTTAWRVFLTGSTFHWGNDIGDRVRSLEIGSFEAAVEVTSDFVESFRIRAVELGPDRGELRLEWENTSVVIPVTPIE